MSQRNLGSHINISMSSMRTVSKTIINKNTSRYSFIKEQEDIRQRLNDMREETSFDEQLSDMDVDDVSARVDRFRS